MAHESSATRNLYIAYGAVVDGNLDLLISHVKTSNFDLRTDNDLIFKVAAEFGRMDIIKYVIEMGCDPERLNTYPLEISIFYNNFDIVDYLVELSYCSFNALLKAIIKGKLNIVKRLIENGCDYRYNNDIALEYAVSNARNEIIMYLLTLGCDPRTKNNNLFNFCHYYNRSSGIIGASAQDNIYFHAMAYIPKKDQYKLFENFDKKIFAKSAFKKFKNTFTFSKNFSKNNFLKFVLKPRSMHIQLIFM
jgi:ankyrin repeat protein